ncbi:hypothetical protein HDU85_004523 [Gaertneriomyces sp. JEL0708]|nr:hypothetical protein HDU85_004523 [Gaertneriomyces sp. JEL0708]
MARAILVAGLTTITLGGYLIYRYRKKDKDLSMSTKSTDTVHQITKETRMTVETLTKVDYVKEGADRRIEKREEVSVVDIQVGSHFYVRRELHFANSIFIHQVSHAAVQISKTDADEYRVPVSRDKSQAAKADSDGDMVDSGISDLAVSAASSVVGTDESPSPAEIETAVHGLSVDMEEGVNADSMCVVGDCLALASTEIQVDEIFPVVSGVMGVSWPTDALVHTAEITQVERNVVEAVTTTSLNDIPLDVPLSTVTIHASIDTDVKRTQNKFECIEKKHQDQDATMVADDGSVSGNNSSSIGAEITTQGVPPSSPIDKCGVDAPMAADAIDVGEPQSLPTHDSLDDIEHTAHATGVCALTATDAPQQFVDVSEQQKHVYGDIEIPLEVTGSKHLQSDDMSIDEPQRYEGVVEQNAEDTWSSTQINGGREKDSEVLPTAATVIDEMEGDQMRTTAHEQGDDTGEGYLEQVPISDSIVAQVIVESAEEPILPDGEAISTAEVTDCTTTVSAEATGTDDAAACLNVAAPEFVPSAPATPVSPALNPMAAEFVPSFLPTDISYISVPAIKQPLSPLDPTFVLPSPPSPLLNPEAVEFVPTGMFLTPNDSPTAEARRLRPSAKHTEKHAHVPTLADFVPVQSKKEKKKEKPTKRKLECIFGAKCANKASGCPYHITCP